MGPAARTGIAPAARRVLVALLARPSFWALAVASLFALPLVKSLGAELPEPPAGLGDPPADFVLPDVDGQLVAAADLRGRLVVVTELPLANAVERDRAFAGIRQLRKRLRHLGHLVVYAVLCHGGPTGEVAALLDERKARKPVNVFLVDEERAQLTALRRLAGSDSARFFLLDRHGRVRGAFGEDAAEVDRLVYCAGLLANWEGADPPPAS